MSTRSMGAAESRMPTPQIEATGAREERPARPTRTRRGLPAMRIFDPISLGREASRDETPAPAPRPATEDA